MIAIRDKIYNRSIEKARGYYYYSIQNSYPQNSYLHNLFQFKTNIDNLFIENHMKTIRNYIHRDNNTNKRIFRK